MAKSRNRGIAALAQDSLAYGVGNIATKAAALVLVPILTRALPQAEYGILDLLTSVVVFLSMTLALGLDTALWRFYFDQRAEVERGRILTSVLGVQLLVSSGVAMSVLLAAEPIALAVTGRSGEAPALRLAVLGVPFLIGLGTLTSWFRTRFMILRFNVFAVSQFVLVTGLSLAVIHLGYTSAAAMLASASTAYAILFVAGLALNRQWLKATWSRRLTRQLLAFGLPLVPASVALWSLPVLGRFIVVHVDGAAAVALLAVAAKLATLVALVAGAFQAAWGPFALSIMNRPDSHQTYTRVLTYLIVGGTTIAVVLAVLAGPIIGIVAPRSYLPGSPLVAWLCFGSVATGAYYVTSIGPAIAKRPVIITASLVLAAICNLALAYALTVWIGVEGAAIASFFSLALAAYLPHALTRRVNRIPFSLRATLPIVLVGGIIGVAGGHVGLNPPAIDVLIRIGLLSAYTGALILWAFSAGLLRRSGRLMPFVLAPVETGQENG